MVGILEVHVGRDVVALPVKRASNIELPGFSNDDLVLLLGLWQQVWCRVFVGNTGRIYLDDTHCYIERGLVDEVIWWTFLAIELRVDHVCRKRLQ